MLQKRNGVLQREIESMNTDHQAKNAQSSRGIVWRWTGVRSLASVCLVSLCYLVPVHAQQLSKPVVYGKTTVDPYNTYHRVYAIVPMTGSGSSADPLHPLYAPGVLDINPSTGILAFTSMLSDDGKYALIEIVARQRLAFAKRQADPAVVSFEKGTVPPSTIEAAFAKHKPSFHFSQFNEVPVR